MFNMDYFRYFLFGDENITQNVLNAYQDLDNQYVCCTP